jgi:hypothetical protein
MNGFSFITSPLSTEQLRTFWEGGGCRALARVLAASIRLDLASHQPISPDELQAGEIGGIIEMPVMIIKEEAF